MPEDDPSAYGFPAILVSAAAGGIAAHHSLFRLVVERAMDVPELTEERVGDRTLRRATFRLTVTRV